MIVATLNETHSNFNFCDVETRRKFERELCRATAYAEPSRELSTRSDEIAVLLLFHSACWKTNVLLAGKVQRVIEKHFCPSIKFRPDCRCFVIKKPGREKIEKDGRRKSGKKTRMTARSAGFGQPSVTRLFDKRFSFQIFQLEFYPRFCQFILSSKTCSSYRNLSRSFEKSVLLSKFDSIRQYIRSKVGLQKQKRQEKE